MVESVPAGFERAKFSNPFLDMAGPYYVRPGDEGIIVGTRIHEGQINHINVAHGGVLGTLADVALSLQVHEAERPRLPVATMSLNTNYLAAAKLDDWVEANCRIDRMSKRTAYCSGRIVCGDTVLMTMTAVFAILRK
ncbi:PaaI family thioesterase [Sphingorhabdus sp. 109]|uniref:PaaI family thioesterase n=1 Tax=Sphingorhabdus sp. 109 TaxID=2653173 RepID=UPI0012F13FCF|nr:PaaI family thioesterase [Sphingorhabdus sp. 109]VWX61423.1 Thioesterase superfamily protein [Sphingorhabdus sp. 109]